MSDRGRQIVAELLLVAIATVWGWTFVMVQDAVALYPTLQFLALRFTLASLVLGAVVGIGRLRRRRRSSLRVEAPPAAGAIDIRPLGDDAALGDAAAVALEGPPVLLAPSGRRLLRREGRHGTVVGGVLMGLALGAGYLFQTFGLEHTSASNAGFITGLFVVMVPVLQGVVLRSWVGTGPAIGVVSATVGLFLLSGGARGFSGGDALVFLCAVSFSVHILLTGAYVRGRDPGVLTLLQLATVAGMSAALALAGAATGVSPALYWPRESSVLVALAVTGLLASAVAFYVQTYAQRHSPPARTAVILTMEPVFAGVFGYLLAGDRLGLMGWVGAGLILAGMLVSELWPRGGKDGIRPE